MLQPLWMINVTKAAAAPLRRAAAAALCLCVQLLLGAEHAKPADSAPEPVCRVVAKAIFPPIVIAADDPAVPDDVPVNLGGISDLAILHSDERHKHLTVRVITDRGPTSKLQTPEGRRRVFLNAAFAPSVFDIVLADVDAHPAGQAAAVMRPTLRARMQFTGCTGGRVSGRPNGLPGDESVADPAGASWLPADPNGIDPEGIIVLRDSSMWISEEYRPSLLRCSDDGTITQRYVPQGLTLPGADMNVVANLPARYARRRDNRGFEAIAISPNESTLWLMLQSPLELPSKNAARETGNIRLLTFDTTGCRPTAEYIYRLGDPTEPDYLPRGVAVNDGKICAMAAIDAQSLLVLEQSDDGDARLYRCQWAGATNTLDIDQPLEPIGNLAAIGVACLTKTLVADLGPLLPELAADITAGRWQPKPTEKVAGLKLEGMAIIDRQHVALCNDNDFDIDHVIDVTQPARRSCLWVVAIDPPL